MFLFVSLITAATSMNVRLSNEERMVNQEIPARVDRAAYATISSNIARLFKTSASATGNITINEEMPWNITKAVSDYEAFLANVYERTVTSKINITGREEALYLGNHSKIVYGINKSWFNLTSNKTINYYALHVNASSIQNVTVSDWVWSASGAYVNLTVKDSSGNLALINGSRAGYVNTSRLNSFNITYTNGKALIVKLTNYLLINTTLPINTSTTLDLTGNVYTGYTVSINNSVLEMKKEYRTIVR